MLFYLYLVNLCFIKLILACTYSNILMSLCKPCTKYEMVDGVLKEEKYINLNYTIDHRYLDGAIASKIQKEVILFLK